MTLLVAASAVLLLSDLNRRKGVKEDRPQVALVQYASNALLDAGAQGVGEALREAGFFDGQNIALHSYNAQADMPTANAIAAEVSSGRFQMVITISTPCLQVVASANKAGKATHIFGLVTDPYGAGVGITGARPQDHPAHLVGIGTFQPVEHAFDIAREMLPGLKRVGVVWTPSEKCSEACTDKARVKCKQLGIELLEATVDAATGVGEAAQSLVGRDVQAIWVGGDNTVSVAIDAVLKACNAARIPVFTNTPLDVKRGAFFALGADYAEVGRLVGRMAADVLHGTDPRTIAIENVVPEHLAINTTAAQNLRDRWSPTPDLMKRAGTLITAEGTKTREVAQSRKPQPQRTYKVGIVYFGPDPSVDTGMQGIVDALAEQGFIESRNLEIRRSHANGEIATITPILQTYAASDLDLIMPMTTPCLSAACSSVKNKPVVFSLVYDPFAAGAGKTRSEHLPNMTGVGSFPPLNDLFDAIAQLCPRGKVIGTIYNTSEANSRKVMEVARGLCRDRNLRLVEKTATSTNEVLQAAQSLLDEKPDLLWITGDNTAQLALDGIAKVAARAGLPLVIDDPQFIQRGALLACGIGSYEVGIGAGRLAARVLLGDDPGSIPIEEIAVKRLAVNFETARKLNVTYPPALLSECKVFANVAALRGRAAKVALVQIVDNPAIDRACTGVLRGLEASGLAAERDFTVKRYNAQGETAQLPLIFTTLQTDKPDLIVTAGTPVLLAAARAITDVPIVFTVASDPHKLGIFGDRRPPNIVGVHDDPPVDRLVDLAMAREPRFDTVGSVWDPSQRNSEISILKLREACKSRGLKLVESTAGTVSELTNATQALCQRNARIIVLSADNLTTTGFPAILFVARANRVPVYVTEPSLVAAGATGAIGDDYGAWGEQSGRLAAKVLAGVDPAALSIEKTAVQRTAVAAETVPTMAAAKPTRTWNLHVVGYNDTPPTDESIRGLRDGLGKAGLIADKDYRLKIANAGGDIATLSNIISATKSAGADMVVTISTPTLQVAAHQIDDVPVIFTCVASGVLAGAGKSEADHKANVTGVTTCSPFEEMAEVITQCMPHARAVGTLFTPAEVNSVLYKEHLERALKTKGISLIAVPANTAADIVDAALSLSQKRIDAICQISDNLTSGAFASIARQADASRLPIFGFVTKQASQGAVLALARDYHDAGVESGLLVARVMRGEQPAQIPFTNVQTTRLIVNRTRAVAMGIRVPEDIVKRADQVID